MTVASGTLLMFSLITGLVFVTDTPLEVDSLEWCNDFTVSKFEKFVNHKKNTGQPYRPHEPLAAFVPGANLNACAASVCM